MISQLDKISASAQSTIANYDYAAKQQTVSLKLDGSQQYEVKTAQGNVVKTMSSNTKLYEEQ